MFPLAGKEFPESPDQLARAIEDALSEHLTFPPKASVVKLDGGAWPDIRRAQIDLCGAKVSATGLAPPPKPQKKRQPGITVQQLEVMGRPIRYQASEVNFALKAANVSFDFARDADGQAILVLKDADDGHIDVKIARDDIQSLLLAAASAAARQHGVTIQELQLNLQSQGPRSIGGDVRVKAKKLILSGAVHVRGRVDIDDELVATLSNLSAAGEGVVGSFAAGLIGGMLKQANGNRIPLVGLSLGDVSLHDLNISTQAGLEIAADFGHKK